VTQPPVPIPTKPAPVPPRPAHFGDRIIPATTWAGHHGVPPLTIALTGDSGDGKTTGALSFPDTLFLVSDPNTGKMLSAGVDFVSIGGTDYPVFEKEILPAIARRDPYFERYRTIVLDSASFLQLDIRDTIPDLDDEKKTRGAYAQLKRDTTEPLRKLTKLAIAPRPGAYVWNVVVTCHLQGMYDTIKTDSRGGTEQRLSHFAPLLEGKARDLFNPYFNTVLLMQSGKVEVPDKGGKAQPPETRYFAYTKSPDTKKFFVKDSVGGPPGRWNRLPPKLDVTDRPLYQALTEAWGFPK
jgi:hypothetical protein